jgi:outer membrane protein OmpA-like peptidoglycan-associated protein
MNRILPVAVCSLSLLGAGCATKKYVRNTVDPVRDQVQQVSTQTNQHGTDIAQARKDMERDEALLNSTKEKADSADTRAGDALNRAGDAMNKAGDALAKADKNTQDLGDLRTTVANLDDYKVAGEESIQFRFNKAKLNQEAMEKLDKLATDASGHKRYFIAVEGFTDRVGSPDYNLELSRKRADQVVQYLVAKHGVPLFRVHEIGLGKQMPADEGRGREANAKNRRVTITVYSADSQVQASNAPAPSTSSLNR